MTGIDHEVGPLVEEQAEVILGSRIDDDRHAPGVADLDKGLERHLGVVDDVMRDDEQRGSRAFGDRARKLVGRRRRGLAHRYHLRPRQPDQLLDRRAVAHHVSRQYQHFVLEGARVWESFDGMKVGAGHGCRDRNGNAGGAGGRDESGLCAGEVGDDPACVAVQRAHVEELRQGAVHRIDSLRYRDRGAERRHGARHIDNLAQAEFWTDIVGGHRDTSGVFGCQSGHLRRPAVDLAGVAIAPAGRGDVRISVRRCATVSASPGWRLHGSSQNRPCSAW